MTLRELRVWAGCSRDASWEKLEEAVRVKSRAWAGEEHTVTWAAVQALTDRKKAEVQQRIADLEQKGVPPSSPVLRMATRELQHWEERGAIVALLDVVRQFRDDREAVRKCAAEGNRRQTQRLYRGLVRQAESLGDEEFQAEVEKIEDELDRVFGAGFVESARSASPEPKPAAAPVPAEPPPPAPLAPVALPEGAAAAPVGPGPPMPPSRPVPQPPPTPRPVAHVPPPGGSAGGAIPPGPQPTPRPPLAPLWKLPRPTPGARADGPPTPRLTPTPAPTPAPASPLTPRQTPAPAPAAVPVAVGAVPVGSLAPGQLMFGRYTLKRKLGRGGMGIVWLAHDSELERDVALKFFPDIVAYNRGAVEELKRETRRCLELNHHHIVRVYDLVHDDSYAAIAMEYVDGDTLANRRGDQPGEVYSVDSIRGHVQELCEALEYAHTKAQVVHRDLKPANLMVNQKGELKVTDFGIARSLVDSVSRITQSPATSGTLSYMSPQQMLGQKPTVSDDIYGLGATLYELFTGKPPFFSGDISLQVRELPPPTLAARRRELCVFGVPDVPPEWEAVIAACLAKDPGQRPQSAREVAERSGLAGTAFMPKPPGAPLPAPGPPADDASRPAAQSVKGDTKRVASSAPAARRAAGAVEAPDRASEGDGPIPKRPRRRVWPALVGVLVLAALGVGYWHFYLRGRPLPWARAEPRQGTNAPVPEPAPAVATAQPPAPEAPTNVVRPVVPRVEPGPTNLVSLPPVVAPALQETGQTSGTVSSPAPIVQPPPVVPPPSPPPRPVGPQPGQRWTNLTLNMAFLPVEGIDVLVAKFETRFQDFRLFVDDRTWPNRRLTWQQPKEAARSDLPAVNVSWAEATNFCAWLTAKERAAKRLAPNQSYRLPTDLEWGASVGLTQEAGDTPERRGQNGLARPEPFYLWGTNALGRRLVGNYDDRGIRRKNRSDRILGEFPTDPFSGLAPVGQFPPNAAGLHDVGGNVAEWCLDLYEPVRNYRVVRDAAFDDVNRERLLATYRDSLGPSLFKPNLGFRCVLDPGPRPAR